MSGVTAFQIPANTEEICVSAYANRLNGTAIPSTATAALWAHSFSSRGSRSRVTARNATRTTAPLSTRPRATYAGGSAETPTLMNKKLEPQIRPNAASPGSHCRAETAAGGAATAGAVVVTASRYSAQVEISVVTTDVPGVHPQDG